MFPVWFREQSTDTFRNLKAKPLTLNADNFINDDTALGSKVVHIPRALRKKMLSLNCMSAQAKSKPITPEAGRIRR